MKSDHALLPYATALAAVGLFSLMDALMKGASLAVGAYSALLLRNLIGVALIGPAWLASRDGWPARSALKIHVIRGLVGSAMAFTFFWGLARVPLAEGIALSFIAPLVALYLAAILLGEQIAPRAVGASLLGIAGVAVIVFGRAGAEGAHEDALWGTASILASSMLYAWNLVLQRQQSLLAGPVEVATFQTAMMALMFALRSRSPPRCCSPGPTHAPRPRRWCRSSTRGSCGRQVSAGCSSPRGWKCRC